MTITQKIATLMACTFSLGLTIAYFVLNPSEPNHNIKTAKMQIAAKQQMQFPLLLDLQKNKVPFPNNGIRIINFWATWCDSCIREIPLLNQLQHDLSKITGGENATVIGIALDNPSEIRQYLQKVSLNYPILLGGIHGMELMTNLGNETGNLPYTVILNEKNEIIYQKMGELKVGATLSELYQAIN